VINVIATALVVPDVVIQFLIFAFLVPLLLQIVKAVGNRFGARPADGVLQGGGIVLSVLFVYLNGGFLGLVLPAFPVWGGDFFAFAGGLIGFLGAFTAFVLASWGPIEAAYRLVLKAIFDAKQLGGRIGLRVLRPA
jgi:hypothetical protein